MKKILLVSAVIYIFAWLISLVSTLIHKKNYGPYAFEKGKIVSFQRYCNRADYKTKVHLVVAIGEKTYRSGLNKIGNFPTQTCFLGNLTFFPYWINDLADGAEIVFLIDKRGFLYFGIYSVLEHFLNVLAGMLFIFLCLLPNIKKRFGKCDEN